MRILIVAAALALCCGGSSTASGDLVSGSCTYVSPPASEGAPSASVCYTYTNAPASAATGDSGLCPPALADTTVTTVSTCPTTLGSPAVAQLGTCKVGVSTPAYSYTILYYAGADYATCAAAALACANQATLAGYTAAWTGINGCSL
jgi:hypothetical protein